MFPTEFSSSGGTGRPRSKFAKAVVTITTAGLLGLGIAGCTAIKTPEQKAAEERYAKAKALFEERCKTAGMVIHRTVTDVEGIELTKVRQPVPWGGKEYFDPMWAEAAMASEHRGNAYIHQFLMAEDLDKLNPSRRGTLMSPYSTKDDRAIRKYGYRFVEIPGGHDGQRVQAVIESQSPQSNLWLEAPRMIPIVKSETRYALDYSDIVDSQDREHWIAGTVLTVIDKQTGEVLAQLKRYVWDPGFGVSTTGRWPWQHASGHGASRNCPSQLGVKDQISRAFVDSVLVPKQGN